MTIEGNQMIEDAKRRYIPQLKWCVLIPSPEGNDSPCLAVWYFRTRQEARHHFKLLKQNKHIKYKLLKRP